MANHVTHCTSALSDLGAHPARRSGLRPELAAFFALGQQFSPSPREHLRGILAELAIQQGTD